MTILNPMKDAKAVWKHLNGVMCIYKPPQYSWQNVKKIIQQKIFEEVNAMIPRKGVPHHVNPLVVGPWLNTSQIDVHSSLPDYFSSGVTVVGLRTAWNLVCMYNRHSPVKVYQVKGRLGIGTDTFDMLGKVLERANYLHVKREILEKVVAGVQSQYQRSMYDACGVNMQTQAAYELAVRGLVRPVDRNLPVFYSIKCLDFALPEFTLEVHCINEKSLYLKKLIHEIGFRLRTVASCAGIRCIRCGPFTVEHTLARHNWKVEMFLENMEVCTKMLITELTADHRKSPNLIEPSQRSWEDTEKILLERGVIENPLESQSGENVDETTKLMLSNESVVNETHA